MSIPSLSRSLLMSSAVVFLLAGCGDGGGSSEPDLISCSDAAGEAGSSVTLSCQANGGVSGLSLAWKVTAPNGSDVDVSENGLSASFTPASAGTYNVKATATAGDETEVESFVANIGNPKPTVSCPSQLSVKAKRSIIVDCTASDHANRELAYQWTLISPTGVTAQLTTDDEEDAVFTPPAQGTYSLTVTVTAPDGKSATADVTVNAGAPGPWRIVAIGDSITQSNLLHQSYRYKLWKKLVDKGVDFNLIGTQHSNANQDANGTLPAGTTQVAQPDYKNKSFDPDHEAYWGQKAGQVATRLLTTLPQLQAQGDVPDIALIHLGTNELLLGPGSTAQKAAAAIDGLENAIDALRAVNPQVTILLAKIIPFASDTGEVPQLNQLIDAVDDSKSQPGSPVIIVDQYSGFNSTVGADTFDGIHPNDSGEEKIAGKFFSEIDKIIK